MSSLPLLGYRVWRVRQGGLRSYSHRNRWETVTCKATCKKQSHFAPDAGCSCGVHAYTKSSSIRNLNLIIFFTFYLPSMWFLAGLVSSFIWGPLSRDAFIFSCVVCFWSLIIFLFIRGQIRGIVACTGNIVLYDNGFRAEQARIVALVKPWWLTSQQALAIGEKYAVPMFSSMERAQKYAIEFGSFAHSGNFLSDMI